MEEIVIGVDGMMCGHCEIAIADAIRKLPGIDKVTVRRRKKAATVAFDPGVVTPDEIRAAIAQTGYDVV